jgi:DNA polymerase I-like protein with 3'-5' exonuclease and polymerase domains
MLANEMWRFDNGAYAKEVVDGDIHTANQTAAELPTRNDAKTFIYAFLYGAGDAKIGSIIGKGATAGREIKKKFFEKVPALERLVKQVKAQAGDKGYLLGLDGRQLHIRSTHAALNTLLQSAGALVCKQWLVEVDKELRSRGWQDRCQQVAWIHDELQFDCDAMIAEECGQLIVDCIAKAGQHFNVQVPLTGEYNIGANWAETH